MTCQTVQVCAVQDQRYKNDMPNCTGLCSANLGLRSIGGLREADIVQKLH